MDALPVPFYRTFMAGSAIGFLQFAGMGQALRIVMTGRTVKPAMAGLFVSAMAVKTFVCAEQNRRKKKEDQDGENISHCYDRSFSCCLLPITHLFNITLRQRVKARTEGITFSGPCR